MSSIPYTARMTQGEKPEGSFETYNPSHLFIGEGRKREIVCSVYGIALNLPVGRLGGRSAVGMARARRLVECWNACREMERPEEEVLALRDERDALVNAIERLTWKSNSGVYRSGVGTDEDVDDIVVDLLDQAAKRVAEL